MDLYSNTQFDSEIDQLIQFNQPLSNISSARWQRKESAASSNACTPKKQGLYTTKKTPCKTPSADRFIPNRSAMNMLNSQFNLVSEPGSSQCQDASPTKAMFQKNMLENLGNDTSSQTTDSKILSFRNKAPLPRAGYRNNLNVLYSHNKHASTSVKPVRHIPQTAERILDAPDMLDDYYLNLLDWSSTNVLAVALGASVYLWNATSGTIQHLMQVEGPNNYVASVSWIKEGNFLAIGTADAEVQLWDVESLKQVRGMKGHSARVGALSWNSYICSSGSRSGAIHHHDVRVAEHHVGTLQGHAQDVCGLKWSPNGTKLASGGNDNILNIWDVNSTGAPKHRIEAHSAAVKALAWCPWQNDLLASGGGTADRCVKFWNANSGSCLSSIDTKSQVCSILWNAEHKEVVTSHGFSQNQLTVWKYPTMQKVAELTGHTSRVLHMAMSPDGRTVVSAAGDETLRFWKIFGGDAKKRAHAGKQALGAASRVGFRDMIR